MKLNIGHWDVDIKAKATWRDRANKEDLGYFLNYVSLLASEARNKWQADGYPGLAAEADRFMQDIDAYLKEMGMLP